MLDCVYTVVAWQCVYLICYNTAEPLVPDPSPFEVEIAIAKLKSYKSPRSYQIKAELIEAGGEILRSKID
jgi:hypothetical protein